MTGSLDRDKRRIPRMRPEARSSDRRSNERLKKNDDDGMSLSALGFGDV
jgi:hypothetical protein